MASSSCVRLDRTLQVGFSGHRAVPNEVACRAALLKILSEWNNRFTHSLSAVSSLAAGGDLLFAEVCFELNIPLEVLLPLPEDQFKEDFNEKDWARMTTALSLAASVEVVMGAKRRPECYYDCGVQTIDQCGLLIALWNGMPAQGMGGTADMVRCARDLGIPTIWIHSDTNDVRSFNVEAKTFEDPELDSLNRLPDRSSKPDVDPNKQAVAWFNKLNENANQIAPQFRKAIAVSILCSSSAAVMAVAGYNFRSETKYLLATSVLLGVAATMAHTILRAKKKQKEWSRIRGAAEVCRSVIAIWDAPVRYNVFERAEAPELMGMINSLNYLKIRSGLKASRLSLDAFKAAYQKERITDQTGYFGKQAEAAKRNNGKATLLKRAAILLAIAGNVYGIVSRFLPLAPEHKWLELVVVSSFQVASTTGAIVVVNDYTRRQRRFTEMNRLMMAYGRQLAQARTWYTVLQVVRKVEKALLAEVFEWRGLFANQKLGK